MSRGTELRPEIVPIARGASPTATPRRERSGRGLGEYGDLARVFALQVTHELQSNILPHRGGGGVGCSCIVTLVYVAQWAQRMVRDTEYQPQLVIRKVRFAIQKILGDDSRR